MVLGTESTWTIRRWHYDVAQPSDPGFGIIRSRGYCSGRLAFLCSSKYRRTEVLGREDYGQLGTTTASTCGVPCSTTPVTSASGTGFTSMSLNNTNTCAITTSAGLVCWGDNSYGQTGNATLASASPPSTVTFTNPTNPVTAVAVGFQHTCAVQSGAVYCWGDNTGNQISVSAIGSCGVSNCSYTPVLIPGLGAGVDTLTVAAGASHTCATLYGRPVCWGGNAYGQLGINSVISSGPTLLAPLASSAFNLVNTGGQFSCGLKNGAVKCWGRNDSYQLGAVTGGSTCSTADCAMTPISVSGLASGVTALASGTAHSCAIVSGVVKCWGTNSAGQLGNGTSGASQSTPVQATGNGF